MFVSFTLTSDSSGSSSIVHVIERIPHFISKSTYQSVSGFTRMVEVFATSLCCTGPLIGLLGCCGDNSRSISMRTQVVLQYRSKSLGVLDIFHRFQRGIQRWTSDTHVRNLKQSFLITASIFTHLALLDLVTLVRFASIHVVVHLESFFQQGNSDRIR